jgi:mannose-1-phosphate guanylyltransferase / mannose-6-phosphate isomerase
LIDIGNLNAVVLAGGSGQRFWPLSRELSPKQMLDVFGTESLIAQAIHRILPYVQEPSGGVLIVTSERLFDELRNHLSAQPDAQLHHVEYLVEPVARNTGPAIALAAAELVARDPEAIMIVLPSDHLLEEGPIWADAIAAGARLAADDYLVTMGIAPTRPETGYGYIRAGERLSDFDEGTALPHRAAHFVEKPDASTAARFIAAGGYTWNAGIFVMKAARVLEELRHAGPQGVRIADTAEWVVANSDPGRGDEARERFGSLEPISIDKAVMERSSRVAVIPAPLNWSDVGSLLALEEVAPPDAYGNVRHGRGIDIDSEGTVVFSTDRLVATLGVKDLIIVDTSDATLVVPKDRAQDVRLVVDALKAQGAPEVTQPKVSLRPWGSWTSLLKGPGYQIKLLEFKQGAKASLQRHQHRHEHWIVVAGTALVTRDADQIEVHTNESVFIPVGSAHRIENCGKVMLQVIEVQVGEYLGEDDIIRLADDWNREAGA